MAPETESPRRVEAPEAPTVKRVAVFGGSFNPPHVAHVLAAVYALSVAPVDEVLVVPVFRHPFAKELAPFDDRLAMCELAMGWIPGVRVSAVERDLGGESLTLRTLVHLAAENPSWCMRLLVGSDVVPDLPKWHRFDEVAKLASPLVLPRAGATEDEVLLPDVSSTQVRARLGRAFGVAATGGDPAEDEILARLLPSRVLAYALSRGLYRERAPSSESP